MGFLTIENIKLTGISACVPKFSESNLDYDRISESERELLVKTTGIKYRRIASPTVTTSDMCYEAAQKLISELNVNKNDIEIIVFVSQSPDYFLPATSIILQNKLGLSKSTVAFDIQLGCSGYVYGLSVISTMMSSGKFKKGLLLVGDKSSLSLTKTDKSAYPIFGDAGSATLLEYDHTVKSALDFNLQSDGEGHRAIIIKDGGARNPYSASSDIAKEIEPGIKRSDRNLVLDGIEIFNFSLREVVPNISSLLEYNKTNIDTYDYFVFHQANKLINESIRKKLKIESEKVPYSLDKYGNTSSASIPLTIVSELSEAISLKPKKMLLSAFGVGLSWGSVTVSTDHLRCLPIIEI